MFVSLLHQIEWNSMNFVYYTENGDKKAPTISNSRGIFYGFRMFYAGILEITSVSLTQLIVFFGFGISLFLRS